jgi:MEMO1 family protein
VEEWIYGSCVLLVGVNHLYRPKLGFTGSHVLDCLLLFVVVVFFSFFNFLSPFEVNMSQSECRRRALHAGSWYTDTSTRLTKQLNGWLETAAVTVTTATPDDKKTTSTASTAGTTTTTKTKAIIAPHAGYSYCGATAAFAYTHLAAAVTTPGPVPPTLSAPSASQTSLKRIFILGPSHHHYTDRCELSGMTTCETPIGDLIVDTDVITDLVSTGKFDTMSKSVDEEEHSIEMHLPYIAHILKEADQLDTIKIVPILIGSLSTKDEMAYGALLQQYVDDDENFFVVSSDFCHWGSRFRYTHYDESKGKIWQSIEHLDRQGMDAIETMKPEKFTAYLKKYRNTICGRHPISVLLQAMSASSHSFAFNFVSYAQSSKCTTSRDSSVSYAAGVGSQL